jgi:V8-like Glu-specific endopeptidase
MSGSDERGSIAPGEGAEPPAADDGAEDADGEDDRAIVGPDDRVRVTRSTTYPYTTVGYLEMENAAGEVWSCSAALIGPRTVLTAGHCLYAHEEEGGWRDNFMFWPALNGESDVPFEGIVYETAYVFDAFITNYDGSYDAVWPYDIGVVTLAEPVGDTTGWLGYWNYADLGDFQANIVGYHEDKEWFTMWRATCNVIAENVREYDFLHDCDSGMGSSGSPIYVYDQAAQGRYIVGVHVGEEGSANWGLRLYQPVLEWVQQLNQ